MKTKKVLIVLTMLCLLTAGAFAQVDPTTPQNYTSLLTSGVGSTNGMSGISNATAGAITGDADIALDLNNWSQLSVNNFYGFTQLGTNDSCNLGFATNTNGYRVAGFWYGNLWSGTPENIVTAMIGQNNWGAALTWSGLGDMTILGAGFGYNLDANTGLHGSVCYLTYDYNHLGSSADMSGFGVTAGVIYHLEQKNAMSSLVAADIAYGNISTSAGDTKLGEATVFSIQPAYRMQYKPAGNFTYGLAVEAPFEKVSAASTDTTTFSPVIRNGLSISVAKNLLLNLGIKTALPSITKVEDSDPAYGDLENTFTGGVTIPLSNVGTLDTFCGIAYNPSLDDLWNTNFNIVVSLHF